MAAAAPHVHERTPERIARREGLAHGQAEPAIARAATGNLWGEGEKLLVDQPRFVERAQ